MKIFITFILIACTVGCSTVKSQSNTQTKIPPGTEELLDKAYRIIDAYQNDDSKTWSELVCMASTNEKVFGLSSNKFLRKLSVIRLVSISSVSVAGNSVGKFQSPTVVIEVHAEGYPVGDLLLTFFEERNKCVSLMY